MCSKSVPTGGGDFILDVLTTIISVTWTHRICFPPVPFSKQLLSRLRGQDAYIPCIFHSNQASTSSYLYNIYYSNTTRCLISQEISRIQNFIKCSIILIHSSKDWICFRTTRLQPLLTYAFPSTKVQRLSRSFVRYAGFGELYTTTLLLCLAPKLPTVRSGTEGQIQMYLWQERTVTERSGSQPNESDVMAFMFNTGRGLPAVCWQLSWLLMLLYHIGKITNHNTK